MNLNFTKMMPLTKVSKITSLEKVKKNYQNNIELNQNSEDQPYIIQNDLDLYNISDDIFINYELAPDEYEKTSDGLLHLTKNTPQRQKFKSNVNIMNKNFVTLRNNINKLYNKYQQEKDKKISYKFFNIFKPKRKKVKLEELKKLDSYINNILKLRPLGDKEYITKSSYMPEISDLAIISYLREANKIINNIMNSSLNKKSFLGTYINNLSESIKKFDLDDFEIKSKENYHYKVKRFIQKIALVAKNYSINSNYIQKKYKNMNNNTMNIYYKDGNIRKKYLSVNDYLEQLLKNYIRMQNAKQSLSFSVKLLYKKFDVAKRKYPLFIERSDLDLSEKEIREDDINDPKITIIKNNKNEILSKIKVSPQIFEKLFPINDTKTMSPIQWVENCYLVNSFNEYMKNDDARINLYKCFNECEDNLGNKFIEVKYPNLDIPLKYYFNNDNKFTYEYNCCPDSLDGVLGHMMLEEVYAVNRISTRLEYMIRNCDSLPLNIKKLLLKHKTNIEKRLVDTSKEFNNRLPFNKSFLVELYFKLFISKNRLSILKELKDNYEIYKVLNYDNKECNKEIKKNLKLLRSSGYISNIDYKNFLKKSNINEAYKNVYFYYDIMEEIDQKKFNKKTNEEKQKYYEKKLHNHLQSYNLNLLKENDINYEEDEVDYNDYKLKYKAKLNYLFQSRIMGFETLNSGNIRECNYAMNLSTSDYKSDNIFYSNHIDALCIVDSGYNFFDNLEGCLVSQHVHSINGWNKYGAIITEPNTSNQEEIILFDKYKDIFNKPNRYFYINACEQKN